jgi:hypothetical protein
VLIADGCGEYGEQATGLPHALLLPCCLFEWLPWSPRGASDPLPGVAGATRMLLYVLWWTPRPPSHGVGGSNAACRRVVGGVGLHHVSVAACCCCLGVFAGLDMMLACVLGPVRATST